MIRLTRFGQNNVNKNSNHLCALSLEFIRGIEQKLLSNIVMYLCSERRNKVSATSMIPQQASNQESQPCFINATSHDRLHDGYSDPLIDLGRRFPIGDFPPIDKFGWFYQVSCQNNFLLKKLFTCILSSFFTETFITAQQFRLLRWCFQCFHRS